MKHGKLCNQNGQSIKTLEEGGKYKRHSKREAITSKVIKCGQSVKKLYMLVKELTGTSAVNSMPDGESDQKLSEEFANLFLGIIHKIICSMKKM